MTKTQLFEPSCASSRALINKKVNWKWSCWDSNQAIQYEVWPSKAATHLCDNHTYLFKFYLTGRKKKRGT